MLTQGDLSHRMMSGPSFPSMESNDLAEAAAALPSQPGLPSQGRASTASPGALSRDLPLRQQWRFTKILVVSIWPHVACMNMQLPTHEHCR